MMMVKMTQWASVVALKAIMIHSDLQHLNRSTSSRRCPSSQSGVGELFRSVMDLVTAAWNFDLGQQGLYDRLRAAQAEAGVSDQLFFVLVLGLCHSAPMYVLNVLYTLFTHLMPKTSEKWRVLPNKRANPDLVRKAIAYVTAFHMLSVVGAWFCFPYAIARQPTMFTEAVPGAGKMLAQLILCVISTDFFFYWMHRFLHTPLLYRAVHKQHHLFTVTVGFAAEYAHPVEMLLGNVFPVLSGPVIFSMPFAVWAVWLAIAMTSTVSAHSGLWYPSPDAGWHDWHHSANIGNYGATPFWDRLMGTDRGWDAQQKKLKTSWAPSH